jgi:hypothetical protein
MICRYVAQGRPYPTPQAFMHTRNITHMAVNNQLVAHHTFGALLQTCSAINNQSITNHTA